jgi:hypothetical protein
MNRGVAAASLAAALLVAPAAAQRRGSLEAGLIARATLFDPSLGATGAVGVGARLGVYIAPAWLVETDISTSNADGLESRVHVIYRPLRLRLTLLEPYSERGTLLLGVGGVTTHYGGDLNRSDNGFTALLGIRAAFWHSLFGRVDMTMDYVPTPANGAGDNWNGGLQLGLGYFFRR